MTDSLKEKRYYLDLFAGIGGFALGAYWAGMRFEGHYFSEVDEYAIAVYERRFPDAVNLGDIRGIRGADLPPGEWVFTGGFPCQDISCCGKKAGLAGERSGLFYEYARLICEVRPRLAVMENVGALLVRGMPEVLGTLAEAGYDAEWCDIRAIDVTAPHRRERIWLVCYPIGSGCEGDHRGHSGAELTDGRAALPDTAGQRRSAWEPEYEQGTAQICCAISDADCVREQQQKGMQQEIGGRAGDIRENVPDTLGKQLEGAMQPQSRPGLPAFAGSGWWAVEPDVGRVAYGIPKRVDRVRCLGNAIVPHIAKLIFEEVNVC